MPRRSQRKALKGSQHWLQDYVNLRTDILDDALRSQLGLANKETVTWLSPIVVDEYAEYQDDAFLDRLGIQLDKRDLSSFWPLRGPCWDGLAKTSCGKVLLVEAKANVPELKSTCGAGPQSMALIQSSLSETATALGASTNSHWSEQYYQYANRLAHLHLLRQLNGVPAFLVFIYFVNDFATHGPTSVREWKSSIEDVHTFLGINHSQLAPYVIDLFFDVTTHTAV